MLLARGGMNEAFDEIVMRHQHKAMRIAMKFLGNSPEARDVTQNSFVEVYRYLQHYQPAGKFVSFLSALVVNQCRGKQRSRLYEQRAMAKFADQPVLREGLPEDQILAREKRREVEWALSQLSTKLSEVLILRYAGDLSYQEIAEALHLRLGTVKSRIFNGLERLNRILEAKGE